MRAVPGRGRQERAEHGRGVPAQRQRGVGVALPAQLRSFGKLGVRFVAVPNAGLLGDDEQRRGGGATTRVRRRWRVFAARLSKLLHAGRVPVAHEPHATGKRWQPPTPSGASTAAVAAAVRPAAQAQVRDGMSARVRVLQEQRRDGRVLQVALPQGSGGPRQVPDIATVQLCIIIINTHVRPCCLIDRDDSI